MKDLTTAQIESLEQLIEEQNTDRVRDLIKDLHPADIAELFQDLDLHDAEWKIPTHGVRLLKVTP